MHARDHHPCLILACLLALTSAPSIALAGPATTLTPIPQPLAGGASELSPEARRRLATAAQDSVLTPWQRDFMIGVARGGVAGAAGAGSADPVRWSASEDVIPADGRWAPEPPPNARYHHTAAYDPVRDRMVVFGGYAEHYKLVNDVWVLSLSGSPKWTKVTPLGTPPSARHQHSAIYDPVRDRVVVFGGYEVSSVAYLNDAWALSLGDSPRWTRLAPAGTPPITRFAHSAIYDAQHDRMIVFGGYHSDPNGTNAGPLNDVWGLSLSDSTVWTEISPTGAPPIARYGHSAIYDPVRRSMIVFAGFAGGVLSDDVWELSLSESPAWTELSPTGTAPVSREYFAAIYDPMGDRMVIFGGYGNAYLGDSWALSLTGAPQWSPLTPAGPQPIGRSGQSGIYDPLRRRMLVYGGAPDGQSLLVEVWGLSLDGGTSWANLFPNGGPPLGQLQCSAIYDPLRDRMVLFGGGTASYVFGDVWALSLAGDAAWTLLTPSGTPPGARSGHSAIYDPVRDRMVVFGGADEGGNVLNDTWALCFSGNPAWTQLNPSGIPPDGREGHTAIYDAANDRMVVFGGASCCRYLNDVWALSLAGDPAWTPITPPGAPPDTRGFHSAIYDPVRVRMIVYGGLTYGLYFLNDIWVLPLVGVQPWSRITPGGQTPRGSEGHTAIYDPIADRMVVFGGFNYDDIGFSNQTGALSLTVGPTWGLLATGGTPPDGRYLHSAIYDPVRDRMLIFGGYPFPHDAWELTWGRDLPLAVPVAPGARASAQLFAYPNPSRGDVTISFALPKASAMTLRVFDVSGRVESTLLNEILPAGPYSAHWDRRTASGAVAQPGLYIYELDAGGQRAARTLVLVR